MLADVNFLTDYIVLVVVGICLCVGYILKNAVPKLDNRYIPAIMGVLGVVIVFWIHGTLTSELLLQGLASGLASTGLHQVLTQFINKNDK